MDIPDDLMELGFAFDGERGLYYGDIRVNFGVEDYWGGEAGGHDTLVHVLLPARPDLFLVAHLDETEIEQEILGSSERTWFPAFVAWSFSSHWFFKEEVLEHQDRIKAAIRSCEIEGLDPYVEEMFKALNEGRIKEYIKENYYRILAVIEKGSFIGEYAELKLKGDAKVQDWVEYVSKYEFSNLGFYEMRGEESDTERHKQIPVDLTYELLTRNGSRNLGSIGREDLLEFCTRHCYEAYQDQDLPMVPLIRHFGGPEKEEVLEYELYYAAGKRFEAEGDLYRALNSYENAVILANGDYEESYGEALNAIFDLAPKFEDEKYLAFIEHFKEYSDADF